MFTIWMILLIDPFIQGADTIASSLLTRFPKATGAPTLARDATLWYWLGSLLLTEGLSYVIFSFLG